MSLMGIMIIFALSYNMLLGQTGLLSFGHAVYYGLGGFLAVHAMNLAIAKGLPLPVALVPLAGGLTGLFFGIVFGAVSTRRAGTAFAMISLGIGELVASSALILRGFFGGEEGITTNRTKLFRLFEGVTFGPQLEVYYLIAAWCFLAVLAMYAITRTPFGRIANAVRDNPERAEFIGYSARMVRFIAFCLSGFFAGIAGGLAAINFEIMNSVAVGAAQSGSVLLMTYIGGAGAFIGPIIGAVVITHLQVSLSDVTGAWMLYFGLLFVLVVLYAPGGLAGLILRHTPLWRAGTLARIVPAYLLAAGPALLTLAGAILVIEMAHHLLVSREAGTMTALYVSFDAAAPLPWAVALALLAGGFALFRLTWPVVAASWDEAMAPLRGGGRR
jgi:branched-chain amino acid transport system permease protein